MRIERIVLGPVFTNTYVVTKGNEVVVIDPSFDAIAIKQYIKTNKVVAFLLTHGHYDHIGALEPLKNEYSDAPIYIHEKEEHFLREAEYNLSNFLLDAPYTYNEPVNTFKDGDVLKFLGEEILCIHTPGHSYGSSSFYIKENHTIFSGDTLFHLSIGRSDFPTGDLDQLLNTIRTKLFTLPEETVVYPGHNEETDIKIEKEQNPFFK